MLASDVFSSVLILQLSRLRRSMCFLISTYALFLVVVLLCVFFVLFCVFLCSLYCLFCDVSCIVCVCICVLNNCHRVATHLQLNIYHILSLTAQHPHCQESMFSTLETTTNPLNFQLLNYHPVTHFSTFYILSPQKLDGNSKPLFSEFFQ